MYSLEIEFNPVPTSHISVEYDTIIVNEAPNRSTANFFGVLGPTPAQKLYEYKIAGHSVLLKEITIILHKKLKQITYTFPANIWLKKHATKITINLDREIAYINNEGNHGELYPDITTERKLYHFFNKLLSLNSLIK